MVDQSTCTCIATPSKASTRTTAPSLNLAALDTSLEKSTCPGESIKFIKYFFPCCDLYKRDIELDFIVMVFCCSSGLLSKYLIFPARLEDIIPFDEIKKS
jgi:hypothetical protein